MMICSGGKSLVFEVEGYQFPQAQKEPEGFDYDANWLMVKICYSDENGEEEYEDACLLTYELESIIKGFSEIISGKESLYISEFMEPYLKIVFTKAGDCFLLGMVFVYDTSGGVWKERKLSETITQEKALEIVDEMKSMGAHFPQR